MEDTQGKDKFSNTKAIGKLKQNTETNLKTVILKTVSKKTT